MKALPLVLLAGALTSTAALADNSQFVAANNTPETQLCIKAATATPIQMLMAVQESRFSYRQLANSLKCNDVAVGRFAKAAGNDRVAYQFLRRMSRSVQVTDMVALNSGTIEVKGSR
ncbi:DUF3718 domain-containing protein [Gallaecimonas mangrovi]|uniref:DUF3718 domain-containing protein n=1 Tax=Gallaecimonas mangrovi TaxID=2291597 RepID=UPI001865C06B|nr:DUF3718 domain-containing protein [Gallaecimonas mangrovi]